MAKVAYELRADYEDFTGGSVSLPDGEAYDVGEALSKGGGKIVLNPVPGERKNPDDQAKENERAYLEGQIANALSAYPALKTTTVDSPRSSKESD